MTAASNRKISGKTANQKGLAATASTGATLGEWQPSDYHVRQTALETASRIAGGTTNAAGVVEAAAKFYAFLTGAK